MLLGKCPRNAVKGPGMGCYDGSTCPKFNGTLHGQIVVEEVLLIISDKHLLCKELYSALHPIPLQSNQWAYSNLCSRGGQEEMVGQDISANPISYGKRPTHLCRGGGTSFKVSFERSLYGASFICWAKVEVLG